MHQHSVSTSSSSAEANLDHNHDPETRLIAAHRRNIAESVNAEKELLQMVKDCSSTQIAREEYWEIFCLEYWEKNLKIQ
jgi:hypothetical protein